ncbi:hypothetical protein K488DRAFT_74355 [Vararia minispora EC-137]|uniref:Uncharacterized protein n=1 Tax=Vararia minispora EC-137 TaxID=1314806 RepID=A0ACB8Q7Q5_9AGAM|nr:hypothetical protein K488DRAFT_74355 [Vararia minispora EC-137]
MPTRAATGSVKSLCTKVYAECRKEWADARRAMIADLPAPPQDAEEDALWHALTAGVMDSDKIALEDIVVGTSHAESGVLIPEHPLYEACTPAVASAAYRDGDPADPACADSHFLPHADSPDFGLANYLRYYKAIDETMRGHKNLAWTSLRDPDLEAIQYEAVRRLHFTHHLTLDTIDACGVFPSLRIDADGTGTGGLLWSVKQRDLPPWPTARPMHSANPAPAPPTGAATRLQVYNRALCKRCMRIHCLLHSPPAGVMESRALRGTAMRNAPLAPRRTTRTNGALRLAAARSPEDGGTETAPCPNACYLMASDDEIACLREVSPWTEDELDGLRTWLALCAPDALPCELAVVLAKPCDEVFAQRCTLVRDDEVVPPDPHEDTGAREDIKFCDTIENLYLHGPYVPPVAPPALPLSTPQLAPLRSRRASPRARYAGLAATAAPGGRAAFRRRPTRSVHAGENAALEVKRGMYGLGAYTTTRLPKAAFVGEYIGEVNPQASVEHRDMIRRHLNLNYAFQLGPLGQFSGVALEVDAGRLGNTTRYLNHKSDKRRNKSANVEAKYLIAGGEVRIMFLTTRDVAARRELFLDYGEAYFGATHKKAALVEEAEDEAEDEE